MTAFSGLILFLVGAIAGALNAVAGGGSFISFPTLIFTGVPPIQANATNTVALWFGLVVSGGAYRRHLNAPRRLLVPLIAASLVGGVAGALLLLHTPQRTFMHLIPWLLLGASVLFIFGDKIRRRAAAGPQQPVAEITWLVLVAVSVFEFAVSVYGGYFGAGIGFMQLAMLASLGLGDMHAINAIRLVLVTVINVVAVVIFILARAVFWPQALVMMVGSIAGGWLGAHYVQRVAPNKVRYFVIATGIAMTVYFFIKAYF